VAGQGAVKVYARVFGVLLLAVAAAAAGLWLAEKTLPPAEEPKTFLEPTEAEIAEPRTEGAVVEPPRSEPAEQQTTAYDPPLYFFAHTAPGADLGAVADEVEMAARNGIHRYVVSLELPWPNEVGVSEARLEPLEIVVRRDPKASALVRVAFDPPRAWLDAHPEAAVRAGEQRGPYASLASSAWLDAAKGAFDRLAQAVADAGLEGRVAGYVIACLEKGAWHSTGGYDTCDANVAGFRAWLGERYGTDEALREAWAAEDATLEAAGIPEETDANDALHVFFAVPAEARYADFLAYTSDITADAIATLAAHVKGTCAPDTLVLAPYGYTFELLRNDAGHFALMRLMANDIDGFVSPVSYADRGLGGTGGFMGPISSAREHGKQWYLIDDTRTGIIRDGSTGEITPAKGVRVDDVYNVQARNFAAALVHELGVFWADPYAEGELHDEALWKRFGAMRTVYAQRYGESGFHARNGTKLRVNASPGILADVTLGVVADEASRFYQRCDAKLNEHVLRRAADAALRVGVSTRFYLLRDVIDGAAAPCSAYLFLNAFRLTVADRERLHDVLQQTQSAAIWLYAPGYIAETASADNITATVRIPVKPFAEPAKSGSACKLQGIWFGEGSVLGEPAEWSPLFYIDDEEANVLANYEESGRPSAALAFLDEGWVSVYVAEPAVSPALLREILHILDRRLNLRKAGQPTYDTAHLGRDLLAIHAASAGDRTIQVAQPCNVRDLLENEVGWQRKTSFTLPLNTGETRVLQFTPVEDQSYY